MPELKKTIMEDVDDIECTLDALMVMSRLFRAAKLRGVSKLHDNAKEIADILQSAISHKNHRIVGAALKTLGHYMYTLSGPDCVLIPDFEEFSRPFYESIHQHVK